MDIFTPATMTLQSLAYLTAWFLTSLYIHHHGPSTTIAPIFTKYHNRSYSLFSLLLCLFILLSSQEQDHLARKTFHLSKFYEYIDILSVTALHTHRAIDLHFGFHHLTTPWLTFVRVLPDDAHEHWRWFAAANTAHHALMYAYFGGVAGERYTARLGRVLRWTGEGQLLLGMVVDAGVVWGRVGGQGSGLGEVWRFLVSGGLLGVYWVLNKREMRWRDKERARVKAESGNKGDKGE